MQIIEFNYESQDGVIKIPKQYKDWFKKNFKVILLGQEPPNKRSRLPKGAGCYHSGRTDISQRAEELLFQTKEEEQE